MRDCGLRVQVRSEDDAARSARKVNCALQRGGHHRLGQCPAEANVLRRQRTERLGRVQSQQDVASELLPAERHRYDNEGLPPQYVTVSTEILSGSAVHRPNGAADAADCVGPESGSDSDSLFAGWLPDEIGGAHRK